MSAHGSPAPKPENFDALTETWNDPYKFAIERARYYASLRAEREVDPSVPREEVER